MSDEKILEREQVDTILYDFLRTIQRFERKEEAQFDLSYLEICALQFLDRKETASIGSLGEEYDLQPFSSTRLVDALEKKGHVKRERDAEDQRVILVRLTEEGTELVHRITENTYNIFVKGFHDHPDLHIAAFMETAVNLVSVLGLERK